MILIEGQVYCQAIEDLHPPEDPDPQQEGPRYPAGPKEVNDHFSFVDNDAWSFGERDGWAGSFWHYTCPGPHFKAWQGVEVDVDEE